MEQVVLEAKSRTSRGKSIARKYRAAGMVPGVAYGHGLEPVPLIVESRALEAVLRRHRGGNVLVELRVDGTTPGGLAAIVKATQHDPVTDQLLSVDFQWVSLEERVTVTVPLRLEGAAAGAQEGGLVEQILHEVEVSCTPLQIPEELAADITHLQIGQTMHVSDLVPPEGVQIITAGDEAVVTVRAPTVVTVETPTAEAEEIGIEEEPTESSEE